MLLINICQNCLLFAYRLTEFVSYVLRSPQFKLSDLELAEGLHLNHAVCLFVLHYVIWFTYFIWKSIFIESTAQMT